MKSKILVGFLLFFAATLLTYCWILFLQPGGFVVYTIALIVGILLIAKTKYEIEGTACIFSSIVCVFADLIIHDPIDGIYYLVIALVGIYIFYKGVKEKPLMYERENDEKTRI